MHDSNHVSKILTISCLNKYVNVKNEGVEIILKLTILKH